MKKRILLSSILTIALCLCLIAGSTFALFTDESKVNIAVTAGKVDVKASIDGLELYSPKKMNESGDILDADNGAHNDTDPKTFMLDGTATLEDNLLTLTNIVPGDKASFKIQITNNSNVNVKYRTIIKIAEDSDTELAEALEFDIGGEKVVGETEWKELTADQTLDCSVLLPSTAGNECKNKTCTISFTVEAVQGNTQTVDYGIKWSGNAAPLTRDANTPANVKTLADVTDTDAKTVKIETPELLAAFAQAVNEGNNYCDWTVTLEADMDLNNLDWTPIGDSVFESSGTNVVSGYFAGNFDGQGHTISNLKVNGGAENPIDADANFQGLFGCLNSRGNMVYIQNLTIHNANIYAKNGAGAFVGNMFTYQHLSQSGQSNIWNCNLTGKVTIKGGNSGGIAGAYTQKWAILTSYQNIVIDVDDGSYVTNVGVEDGAAQIGGVAAVAAYSAGTSNIKTNLDVIAKAGTAGGAFGVVGGAFSNISCTGDVIVKDVDASTTVFKSYAQVLGLYAPVWYNGIQNETLSATGKFEIQLTNGTVVTSNGQTSNLVGG